MTLFQDKPAAWRRDRFWGVCVWVRAVLLPLVACGVLLFAPQPYGRHAVTAAAGITCLLIAHKVVLGRDNRAAWWSRPFHAAMAALIFAVCAHGGSSARLATVVSLLLVSDVAAGAYMSTYRADWVVKQSAPPPRAFAGNLAGGSLVR